MDFRQNQFMKKLLLLCLLSSSVFAGGFVETIKLGSYSGKPGYYAKVGPEFSVLFEAILMNEQVLKKAVQILSKTKLGEAKVCDVVGVQQSIGYTIYSIKSCK